MKYKKILILLLTVTLSTSTSVFASEGNQAESLSSEIKEDGSVPSASEKMPELGSDLEIPKNSLSEESLETAKNDLSESQALTFGKSQMISWADLQELSGFSMDESSLSTSDMMKSMSVADLSENLFQSAITGDGKTMSQVLNENFELSIPQDIRADMNDVKLASKFDPGTVNLQFNKLSKNLDVSFKSGTKKLNKNTDCIKLFDSTYGGIADSLKLEKYSIPKSFDPNSMLKTTGSSFEKAFSGATSSGAFGNVKKSISIGNIFSAAQNGMSSSSDPSSMLMSSGSMSGTLGNVSSGVASQMRSEQANNMQKASKAQADAMNFDNVKAAKESLIKAGAFSDSIFTPNTELPTGGRHWNGHEYVEYDEDYWGSLLGDGTLYKDEDGSIHSVNPDASIYAPNDKSSEDNANKLREKLADNAKDAANAGAKEAGLKSIDDASKEIKKKKKDVDKDPGSSMDILDGVCNQGFYA